MGDRNRWWWLVVGLAVGGCMPLRATVQDGDEVVVSLHRPEARQVLLFNSLDRFAAHGVGERKNGNWSWRLPADKEFSYFFIADGQVVVPECDVVVNDDFGSKNCLWIPDM